ncbi:hypothetical protein [Tuanshanicoccus lijuaniae]|uniref:hypothetical protein n=1 Tax=Aerococcaceae bacterium zg-1292 TaxID=2774330 RepID=UPI001BD890FE|nr:hypothetical protein [Aerococcaceae bacterium zg-A91]MBS4458345.1 hypothetical protein [Aerococcaceae bacterium zg-BR33]
MRKQFIFGIPMIVIMLLIIMGFTAYRSASTLSFEKFFSGMSDKVIVMSAQKLNAKTISEYNQHNIHSPYDGERIAFSNQDVEQIRKIEGVEDIVLYIDGVDSNYNRNYRSLSLSYAENDFSDLIMKHNYGWSKVSNLSFAMQKLNTPYRYKDDYNPKNIKIIAGDYPKDNTNEILVPDIFVMQWMNENDFNKVIGKEVTLDTSDIYSKEIVNEKMKIMGVYQTMYQIGLTSQYTVYASYFEEANSDYYLKEESYQHYKSMLFATPETLAASQDIIGSFDDYVRAVGTTKDGMIIKVSNDIQSVTEKLHAMFPKYQLMSQYEIQSGELGDVYKVLLRTLVLGATIMH